MYMKNYDYASLWLYGCKLFINYPFVINVRNAHHQSPHHANHMPALEAHGNREMEIVALFIRGRRRRNNWSAYYEISFSNYHLFYRRWLVFVFHLIIISAYVIIWPRASDEHISRVNCITSTLPDGMPLQCCNSCNYKLCQFIYYSTGHTSPSLSQPLVCYAYHNCTIEMSRPTISIH